MRMKKSIALSLMLLCSMGMVAGCGTKETPATAAEKYPEKPVTLIVPYAAGGSNDIMARSMEKAIQKHLGQALIVKNVPGGGGMLGWNELVESEPDGYTLGTVAPSVLLHTVYGEKTYHYPSALEPLVQVLELPVVAIVRSDQPWNSMNDLIDFARENPGKIKFGHGGLGAATHVVGEMVAVNTGTNLVQVPFKGEAEALAALLGGHTQLMFSAPSTVSEYVKSGKVKVLGVAATKRMTEETFNQAPTMKDQGIDVVFTFWYGIAVHKGMPAEIKAKLINGLEKTVNDPEYIENMKKLGMQVEYLGQKEFEEKWLTEYDRLRKIVKETGIAEKIAAQKN